jgi:hypothetical protein
MIVRAAGGAGGPYCVNSEETQDETCVLALDGGDTLDLYRV